MPDPSLDELLADFTPPQPYTVDLVSTAPTVGGVHVVIDAGNVVYVGETGHLRRRLREHLRGNRESSVLHKQVGEELDSAGTTTASADDIAGWLGERTLRWRATEDRLTLKAALVSRLNPRFNHHLRSDLPNSQAEPPESATPPGPLDGAGEDPGPVRRPGDQRRPQRLTAPRRPAQPLRSWPALDRRRFPGAPRRQRPRPLRRIRRAAPPPTEPPRSSTRPVGTATAPGHDGQGPVRPLTRPDQPSHPGNCVPRRVRRLH